MHPRVLGPDEGKAGFLGSIGVRFLVAALESGGGFSLVEHPMSARALAAPLHRHSREDEYSYVVEGRVGALLGEDVVTGERGDLIFKPRGQWHTFWNAGDEPARLSKSSRPRVSSSTSRSSSARRVNALEPEQRAALAAQYGLEVDAQSVPGLVSRFGLAFPGEPV